MGYTKVYYTRRDSGAWGLMQHCPGPSGSQVGRSKKPLALRGYEKTGSSNPDAREPEASEPPLMLHLEPYTVPPKVIPRKTDRNQTPKTSVRETCQRTSAKRRSARRQAAPWAQTAASASLLCDGGRSKLTKLLNSRRDSTPEASS